MPVPEEVAHLESCIKRFQQQVVALKTKAADLVARRNTIEVDVSEKAESGLEFRDELTEVLKGEVIPLEEYENLRVALEVTEDEVQECRNAIATLGIQLAQVHEEIPAVEKELEHARAELSKWGVVIPFPARS